MFELAVYAERLTVDEFALRFLDSPVCAGFESGDPVFVDGKSANELLAVVLGNDAVQIEQDSLASPEYWLGWVLAYAQWYLNKPFSVIFAAYPCSELLEEYFPYHEMDISKTVELIASRLPKTNRLKEFRQVKKLSQSQLSLLSGVPVRSIKAYEQGSIDISKAQGDTLYALATVLGCSIEDLIK